MVPILKTKCHHFYLLSKTSLLFFCKFHGVTLLWGILLFVYKGVFLDRKITFLSWGVITWKIGQQKIRFCAKHKESFSWLFIWEKCPPQNNKHLKVKDFCQTVCIFCELSIKSTIKFFCFWYWYSSKFFHIMMMSKTLEKYFSVIYVLCLKFSIFTMLAYINCCSLLAYIIGYVFFIDRCFCFFFFPPHLHIIPYRPCDTCFTGWKNLGTLSSLALTTCTIVFFCSFLCSLRAMVEI